MNGQCLICALQATEREDLRKHKKKIKEKEKKKES
jgi:hypothetical protein